jgi:hypothetical protein
MYRDRSILSFAVSFSRWPFPGSMTYDTGSEHADLNSVLFAITMGGC